MTRPAPPVIAHACGSGSWPANTARAARLCLDEPVDGIEIDVHLTADGEVVVHDDYRLDPQASRLGGAWLGEPTAPIATMTRDALRPYDVGSVRPGAPLMAEHPDRAQWDDEPIPTLEDILEPMVARTDRPRTLIVEIKTSPQESAESSYPDRLTRAVLSRLPPADCGVKVRIIAFDWRVLRLCHALAPELETAHLVIPGSLEKQVRRDERGWSPWADGFDPLRFDGSVARAVKEHSGRELSVYARYITPELMGDAADYGLTVAAWGLDEAAQIAAIRDFDLSSLTVAGPQWRGAESASKPHVGLDGGCRDQISVHPAK